VGCVRCWAFPRYAMGSRKRRAFATLEALIERGLERKTVLARE